MKYVHRLPDDVIMGVMRCNIGDNHTILCRNVDHKCFYEAKTNGKLLHELLLAVSFQTSLLLTFKNVSVSKLYNTDFVWYR